MKKQRKAGRSQSKPDEHFRSGPFEFARFGRLVVGKSHATAEQLAIAHAKMAARFPTLVAEIDALVSSIASRIARLPPGPVLQRAWWEYATMKLGMDNRCTAEPNQLNAMRMIDYVQSVIASVQPENPANDVGENEWNGLKTDVETLFGRLTMEYQMCLTARRKTEDPSLDMEVEEFRSRAEIFWLNVRGKRYQCHERQALLEILAPHSGSRPLTWCKSRESWLGWTPAQLTTADNRAV